MRVKWPTWLNVSVQFSLAIHCICKWNGSCALFFYKEVLSESRCKRANRLLMLTLFNECTWWLCKSHWASLWHTVCLLRFSVLVCLREGLQAIKAHFETRESRHWSHTTSWYIKSDAWQRKSEEPAQPHNFLHYRWGFPGMYSIKPSHPRLKVNWTDILLKSSCFLDFVLLLVFWGSGIVLKIDKFPELLQSLLWHFVSRDRKPCSILALTLHASNLNSCHQVHTKVAFNFGFNHIGWISSFLSAVQVSVRWLMLSTDAW